MRQLLAAEPELLGQGKNVDDLDWATEVCQNSQVRKRVLAELNATGKQAKLKPLEVSFRSFLARSQRTGDFSLFLAASLLG